MKVLLIDDDVLTHDIIRGFLRRFAQELQIDIDIKALHDSVQGVLELSENASQYDVILLDIRLPKLGGDEIYKIMSIKMPELLDRIIIITGSPNQLYEKLPDQDLRVLGKPFRYDMFEFQMSDIFSPDPSEQVNV